MSTPAPRPSDVATLDAILHAFYETVSGAVGQPRDWDRFRSLILPGGQLMPVVSIAGEKASVRLLSTEDFIRRVDPIFAREDFWERETSRQTETIGHFAHVLSFYDSLRSPDGPPFEHGVNSIQLLDDGARWWIVNVMWNTSRAA
ncbi:MAG: hypothetical protein LAO76_16170 [Acidobacteriia bacterium]|nr:hypothetical protein [Terriglobia bacterium]